MKNRIDKTFYDWCKENNKEKLLELWDYDHNKCSPNETYYKSGAIYHFYCENDKSHAGRYISLNSIIFGNISNFRCKECNSFYNWCNQTNNTDILSKWNYELNKLSPKDISKSVNKKFWFTFKIDGDVLNQEFNILTIVSKNQIPIKQKTFYKWCIENNKNDIIDRWDDNLNKISIYEVQYSTRDKYWFKCPKGIHKSELRSVNNLIRGKTNDLKCAQCNSFAQWGIDNICDNFLEKYWDYAKNTSDPFKKSFASDSMVWIKCQEKDYHGSYQIRCYSFNNGRRCSKCHPINSKNVNRYDSLGFLHPEVFKIWSDKNKKSPYQYLSGSAEEVWWKCKDKKHNDYLRRINVAVSQNEFRCPGCVKENQESFLQEKVRLYLTKTLHYNVNHERNCSIIPINPRTGCGMPFDNEVVDFKLIIEVHGEQHYKLCGFHKLLADSKKSTAKEELEYQKWKDKYKKEYAISNGYRYLEIPYNYIDDDKYIDIINNKISEIKQEELRGSFLFCS